MKNIKISSVNARRKLCVHVNVAIASLTPMLDYAQSAWPTLRDHLPANIYAAGFVVIVLANILLHFRPVPDDDDDIAG